MFVSYKEKGSAVAALQAFFFRKDRYPNMKFALPRCEKDYFGCYCLKFYNKSGDVTEDKVMRDFGQFGDVVDVRGPGLFDVTGDDVYVRYKEKSSAEQALIELVGKYDSLCLAPPSDIQVKLISKSALKYVLLVFYYYWLLFVWCNLLLVEQKFLVANSTYHLLTFRLTSLATSLSPLSMTSACPRVTCGTSFQSSAQSPASMAPLTARRAVSLSRTRRSREP